MTGHEWFALLALGVVWYLLTRIGQRLDRVIRLLEIGNDINNERRN